MSRWRRARSRLRDSWERGGVAEVSKDLASYLAWRFAGSPDASTSLDHVTMRLTDLESALGVLLYSESARRIHVDPTMLVSIILPTRNRKNLLGRAIESVVEQSYPEWELLVVDNSDDPLGNSWDDPRIRLLRLETPGAGPARNLGLEEARGQIISFLDDDNEMGPDWLKSIVHFFQQNVDAHVVIGAQVVLPEPGSNGIPAIRYRPDFDWPTITKFNYVDLGMLAHRRITELRFDATLPAFLDWDYIVRLTAVHEPGMSPALSGIYHTDAPGRISYQERHPLVEELRRRFAAIERRERIGVPVLTADDTQALEHLITRIRELAQRPLKVKLADRTFLSWLENLPRGSIELPSDEIGSADLADLIIVGPEEVHRLETLAPRGLVIGHQAHRFDYSAHYPDLPAARRVGDQLWIGARQEFDAESLLPGSALVKLGDDMADD